MTTRIFLSYSSTDRSWCNEFYANMQIFDVDIWYDQKGLYVGDRWVSVIESEISKREWFLLVITPRSWSSTWVRKELALALASHKTIIGVVLEPTNLSGFITTYQLLDVAGLRGAQSADRVGGALGLSRHRQSAGAAASSSSSDALYDFVQVTFKHEKVSYTRNSPATFQIIGEDGKIHWQSDKYKFWEMPNEVIYQMLDELVQDLCNQGWEVVSNERPRPTVWMRKRHD